MSRKILFIFALIIFILVVFFSISNSNKKSIIKKFNQDVIQPINAIKKGDGLPKIADSTITYNQFNEIGEGILKKEVFNIDINNDDELDKIVRIEKNRDTVPSIYEYKIFIIKNGHEIDITPKDFFTQKSADCSYRLFYFELKPKLKIIEISRPFIDTMTTPSIATKYIYVLNNNSLQKISTEQLKSVCNIEELF